jgi:site-specific DNA recombinase
LNRKRAVLQDQATWEGVDLAKVKKDIAEIGKAALCLDELITRERNHSIRGGVIEQVRREWWDRRDVAEFTESEEKALAEWPGYWAGLGIERQREIVHSMFVTEVNPGRVPEERVNFTWPS